jgi:tetratricopeptide (TPR) repeat protein
MFSQTLAAMLSFSFLLTSLVSAQVSPFVSNGELENAVAALAGTVFGSDGKPAAGVRIELQDAGTATPITNAYTRPDGTFELYNIRQGAYEVIADSGDSQVSDEVTIQSQSTRLELRFPRSETPQYSSEATVSVVQLLVPEKAQKIYRKALFAFNRGQNDKALKLLQSALLIEPEFAGALTLRGYIEMAMENCDLQAAQQDLEHAARIDTASPAGFVALGALYNREGRFDDALQASQRGTALSPRTWQGYYEMARASVGKEMYRKALQLLRQAERLGGSRFAGLHLVKACALYQLKLYQNARNELDSVLSREPKSTNAKQAAAVLAEIDAATRTTIPAGHESTEMLPTQ